MKKFKVPLIAICLIGLGAILFFNGCAIHNPLAGQPITSTNAATGVVTTNGVQPPYIIPPGINQASNAAAGVAGALAPINPYAGITDLSIKFVFGLVGSVAGILLQRKLGQPTAAAFNQLATSVAAQGPVVVQSILDHASNFEATYPTVAGVVNQKLPPDQLSSPKVTPTTSG